MSLDHAILGFLGYRPFSGYDLKKMFDASVQHFWTADQSQIYRTLARLTENGWAAMQVILQTDRPDRKEYSITEAGRAELERWLACPLAPHPHHSPELVQIFFAGQLTNEQALALFRRAEAQALAVLEHFQYVPKTIQYYAGTVGSPREAFFWNLTLENGIINAEAQLAWVRSVIERIDCGQVPEA